MQPRPSCEPSDCLLWPYAPFV